MLINTSYSSEDFSWAGPTDLLNNNKVIQTEDLYNACSTFQRRIPILTERLTVILPKPKQNQQQNPKKYHKTNNKEKQQQNPKKYHKNPQTSKQTKLSSLSWH